ncbi:MAG: hypothetical protein QOH61_2062 [Chloroflexota bacterium]|jgi:hypothetical protein|nr:hypothetical protein [Chloroflexota bacterium]
MTDPSTALAADATRPAPRLRLREEASALLDLPWQLPLEAWPSTLPFVEFPVGESRHLVRFIESDGSTYAVKEEPLEVARREFQVLRRLEDAALPAVEAVGLSESLERDTGIVATRFLTSSTQYRRMLMSVPARASTARDRLLDAMASLLVDLHRAGVFWGDGSLNNTLFRRDGDRLQAYLVDAETSELLPSLSDGQRTHDLDILLENVGFGLADLAAGSGRETGDDEAIAAVETLDRRYRDLWHELHDRPELRMEDRQAVRGRVRRLNDLGFSVDEITLEPSDPRGSVRLSIVVTTRRFHARELERVTGIVALENQARLLLNDMREYVAWTEWAGRRAASGTDATGRWLREVFERTTARLAALPRTADVIQAYCDLLEHKWLLSEAAGRDVGLDAALASYLDLAASKDAEPPKDASSSPPNAV